jgi:hypothetical protein
LIAASVPCPSASGASFEIRIPEIMLPNRRIGSSIRIESGGDHADISAILCPSFGIMYPGRLPMKKDVAIWRPL